MTNKIDIAKLYREFEEALTDFVAASLAVDDDPAVVLPRRARLAKARERLCSHPDVEQAKYDRIVFKFPVKPGDVDLLTHVSLVVSENPIRTQSPCRRDSCNDPCP